MKKRPFFVANSSSSSFAVIGERVGLKDVELEESVNYYAVGCGLEGEDIFEVDETLLRLMRISYDEFVIIRAMWVGYDGGLKVDVDLSGASYVWAGDKSYYSGDKENFWRMYQVDREKAKAAFRHGDLTLDELLEMINHEN